MWEPGAGVLADRFKIVAQLGISSAVESYVAEQVSLSRKVALKVIRPDLGVQEALGERFDREIRRLATVDHPAVVRVIDSGQVDKLLYLVTELIEGPLLKTELKGEPLMPERAVDLATQLAEGLAAIHAQGLAHGELRPESVCLTKAPTRTEQAKIADFGLARLLDADSPNERLTLVARAIGPLEYLSPEQVRGAQGDGPSDVYALGVITYQMLAGALPFEAVTAKLPRPLIGVAAHLADHVRLCDLVMKCLETDPKARPTAAELAKKLAALPKPAEPTLFLESMQRPPELPAKPKPMPAAAPPLPPLPPLPPPPPAQPPQLMPSVPMPTVTPTQTGIDPVLAQLAKGPSVPKAAPAKREPWKWLGAAAVAIAAVLGLLLWPSPAREARRLVEMRQPAQALELLGHALRKSSDPELIALKAAAQHLSQTHAEEQATFRSIPPESGEALDPLVLEGLSEDYGKSEDKPLEALLKALPAARLQAVLERFAKEPVSAKQWGALRYLDNAGLAKGLKLVELYSISLESNLCGVRKVSAKRLAQLDDDTAEAALLRLRELPRGGADANCGQDEAAAALQVLKRAR
jgi:serine/threonine protein kinase